MSLKEYQQLIKDIYFEKDSKRGLAQTLNWLTEELGELARAIRKRDRKEMEEEVADVLAWLLSVASILEVDAEKAMAKYKNGCPKCRKKPCECKE